MDTVECLQKVCDKSETLHTNLIKASQDADKLITEFPIYMQHLRCVVTGPARQVCVLPGGPGHTTLAEALNRINGLSITGINAQSFTAAAGQSTFTLNAAPPNPAALEVNVNGSEVNDPRDYTVSGTTLSFNIPLVAGDNVDTLTFIV